MVYSFFAMRHYGIEAGCRASMMLLAAKGSARELEYSSIMVSWMCLSGPTVAIEDFLWLRKFRLICPGKYYKYKNPSR